MLTQESIVAWQARFKQLITEMDTDVEKSLAMKENATYLKNQATGAARTDMMKERYRKTKQAESLKSFGPHLAKTIAHAIFEERINPFPVTDGIKIAIDHSALMLLDGHDQDVGSSLYTVIKQYQAQSAQKVDAKQKALTDFLSRNKDRISASSPVK